jgi:hypothetical protein
MQGRCAPPVPNGRQWIGRFLALAVSVPVLALLATENASARPDVQAQGARSAGQQVDVLLGLRRRQSGLQGLARSVSDPASSRYGRYVGPRRAARRFGARRSTRRRVRAFLRRRDIRSSVDITRTFAEALVPRQTARRLFGSSKRTRGRVPDRLRGAVRVVLLGPAAPDQIPLRGGDGADASGSPEAELEPPHVRTGTPAGCAQGRNATAQLPGAPLAGPAFTPNQLQTAYGASSLHDGGVIGEGIRAAVLGAGGFARDELRAFARCFGIEVPPTRLSKVGSQRVGRTSVEAALDLQMLTLMAPGLERLIVYDVASELWPVLFSAMLDRRYAPGGRLPHVISISAGDCEDSGLTKAQVRVTEHVLAVAAAAGITVLAGSGDNGSFCFGVKQGFYPGSSRWTTSVGGTSLALSDSNEIADEVVWNDNSAGILPLSLDVVAAGGGFSRYLRAPFYQRPLAVWGDRRGYPDVAMFADLFPGVAIYCGANEKDDCEPARAANPFEAGFGTSAATPLLAGAVALANQRRRQAGAPRLGFASPLLYSLGERGGSGALRDVVEGTNDVLEVGCCDAAPGYDLASGWGSVDAQGLADQP